MSTNIDDHDAEIIREFRANHGQLKGNFEGAPVLLLHTRGARSGLERVRPVMYLDLAGRRFVFASRAGDERHPDWYHNLVANPHVEIEVGAERYAASAAPVPAPERDRIFAEQVRRFPGFGEYQEKTSRIIPVVELTRDS